MAIAAQVVRGTHARSALFAPGVLGVPHIARWSRRWGRKLRECQDVGAATGKRKRSSFMAAPTEGFSPAR
jgi:hypothetical protein